MGRESTASIAYEDSLRCSPTHAFVTYTERIGEWWDPGYTANPETLQDVTIEPRVYATHADLGDHDWGEVTVWDPGRRIVHTFSLAQDLQHPSEVAVEFVAGQEPESCTVQFAHGGWTEANAGVRPIMLERFAALAHSDR